MRSLYLVICLIITGICCLAQSGQGVSAEDNMYAQKGDYFFNRYEFSKAVVYYNRAYKKDTGNVQVLLKKADAHLKLNQNQQAELCYQIVVKSGKAIDDEHLLRYALLLFVNKKYDESRLWLEKYNLAVENDIRAQNYLSSIDNQETYYKDSTVQVVENLIDLNTKDSEINPVLVNNKLLFSSSKANSIDAKATGFYDIYAAHYSTDWELEKVSALNSTINSSYHEGPIAISGDGSDILFTRNIEGEANHNDVKLGIYKTRLPNEASEKLILSQVLITNFNHSIGHPAISSDGNTLYFISNPTTGIGGLDIYKSVMENGEWNYPELLGEEVNTKGDEMFPFLYNDSILYFASDGQGGIGGLDLYSINLNERPLQSINLGYPVNSRYDDFSLFLDKNGFTGYFCSNRPGGFGSDDIYKLDLLKFKIKGSIFDVATKSMLEEANMKLLTSDGKEIDIPKTIDGEFEFSILPGEGYTLVIEKEDYVAEEIFFETDLNINQQKEMLIGLQPFQRTEIQLEPGVKYDFNSGIDSISTEYLNNLDKLATSPGARTDDDQEQVVLARQMHLNEGDIYSLHLIKDSNGGIEEASKKTTQLFFTNDTVNFESDSVFLILPVSNETNFNLITDVEHLARTKSIEELALRIDKSPILDEKSLVINDDEINAIIDLEFLMSLSINTTETNIEDSLVTAITAEGFSIIPKSEYTLMVGRTDSLGNTFSEMEIPLTQGIKYNFSSDPEQDTGFGTKLDDLISNQERIVVDTDKLIDVALLSKELEIQEGEKIAFSLLPKAGVKGVTSTIMLTDREFDIASDEKFVINVPYNPNRKVNIQTDLDYLSANYEPGAYTMDIDTFEFFSEITIDTANYFSKFSSNKQVTIADDELEALAELEYLMSMSINTEDAASDSTATAITAEGFSILPQTAYTLKVGKTDSLGVESGEMNILLTPGVKYNFGSDPTATSSYRQKLNYLLSDREGIVVEADESIDIALLSKELEIGEGEEIAFSLMPGEEEGVTSTIFLSDREFDIASNEKFVINVPYTPEGKVNIQTDLDYIQDTYESTEYSLAIDTIDFFSEIQIDTTGLHSRYKTDRIVTINKDQEEAISELEFLMSLSINSDAGEEDAASTNITSEGFSILPQTDYTLKVGKTNATGVMGDELEILLTSGVKYNFGSDPSATSDYKQKLNYLLADREGVVVEADESIDIALLSKDLEIEEGEEIAFSLLPKEGGEGVTSTVFLGDQELDISSDEKFVINVPYTPEGKVNIQTDLDYIQDTYESTEYSLAIDTIDFFSEIQIDTTGLHSRYKTDRIVTINKDQEEAISELEFLMSLSINSDAGEEDTASTNITSEGFSILPQTDYTLKVGKTNATGVMGEELEILLTPGVKYNFGSNPSATSNYRQKLNYLLADRQGIVVHADESIDIALLSKELEIGEGEEIAFSLMPGEEEGVTSTIFLSDREFDIASNEKFVINVPYTPEGKVNIQTDLDYIQDNYESTEYSLAIDTINFFSEIQIDTTGLHSRYKTDRIVTINKDQEEAISELKFLMSLSINSDAGEEDAASTNITSEGFSILPQTDYTLKVGKTNATGVMGDELEILLTSGVKYNFGSDPSAASDYKQKLNYLLADREGVVVEADESIDIALLSKDLEIEEGEEIAFSLLPKEGGEGVTSTVFLGDQELDISSDEKFVINVPYTPEGKVNIQTDLDYIQDTYESTEYSLAIDTIDFFSEIQIDTTGLHSRYKTDRIVTINKDQEEAISELEFLMSLSINSDAGEEDAASTNITTEGFSILPQTAYTLKVGKTDAQGVASDEMEMPLTPGVKYNFGSNPSATSDCRQKLNYLLADRKGIEVNAGESIDISFLSKDLEIGEGEEIAFSLLSEEGEEGITSTIFLGDQELDLSSDEKFVINVPYTPECKVNIQTDLEYLQENYEPEAYTLDIDTIAFFPEITIDTIGLASRYGESGFEKIAQDIGMPELVETANIKYRLQIVASRKPLTQQAIAKKYSGEREVKMFEEEGWYKYYIAEAPTYFEAKQILNKSGVKAAFIVAYEEGEKITLREAMAKQYKERQEQSGFVVSDSIVSVVTVNFEFDKFSLRADEEQYLKNLVITKMKEFPETYVAVNGHTDIRGNSIYNMELSNGRAEFVKGIIVKEGIDGSRVKTFSYGESQVLKACDIPRECDESVHEVNRRVEIILFAPVEETMSNE